MRQLISLSIVGIILCLSLSAQAATYGGGSGTSSDPYVIASKADLLTLGATTADYNYCFILTADIDLAGESFTRAVIAPDPDSATFSFQGTYFTGVFDGNGHVIKNLKIAGAGNDFVGLFGYSHSGQIKNLGLENADIQCRDYSGGLVGFQLYTTITTCYVTGSVKASGYCVGGLVGCNSSGCTITNCYETGTVSGSWAVGGLVGINYGPITSCYATGDISGSGALGGLVGQGDASLATNSFWDTETSHQATSAGGTDATTIQMKTQTTFTDAGWDFSTVWFMPANSYPHLMWEKKYAGGKGTAEDPFQIASVADWQLLMTATADWNKCFILMADINLSGVSVTPVGNDSTKFRGTFDGNRHTISNPAINLSGTSNIGLFGFIHNGQIQNLDVTGITVSGMNEVGGLVGSNYYGTITSCYVTGSVSGKSSVGGLIGYNYSGTITSCHTGGSVAGTYSDVGGLIGQNSAGTVTSCYATGTVSGTNTGSMSGSNSGGLIGYNSGPITSCYATGTVTKSDYAGGLIGSNRGTLTSCYATGSVTTTGTAGGLTGYNYASSTMISCYAAGAVKGDSNAGGLAGSNYGIITSCYATGAAGNANVSLCVGGLAGYNDGTITSCYAAGTAIGTWMIGGLTGQNEGVVTCSYAIGKVTVTTYYGYAGGVAGYNTGSIATNCFWDINTSGQSGSGGGTGRTTDQMWTRSTYTDAWWDFTADDGDAADWQMPAPGYPRLSWESLLYSGGRGTVNEPYCIASIAEWQTLMTTKSQWSKCFILTADLDMAGIALTPIGNESTNFTGSFNGYGHTLRNITIKTPGSRTVGLFGYINGSTVKNLYAENVTLQGGWFVGLIGCAWTNSQVYHVHTKNVSIQGDYYVGGVAGYNYGSMSSCSAAGTVTGNQYVGGLTGWNWGTITSCYAACNVGTMWSTYIAGGLVGHNGKTVASCYAAGAVNAFGCVGGLAGSNDSAGTISSCYAVCDVNGFSPAGGFIGDNTNGISGKITSCFWDTWVSGMSSAVGSGPSTGITGKTTTEMKMLSTFTGAGWDFTAADGDAADWMMLREGEDYPRLAWQTIYPGDIAGLYGVDMSDLAELVNNWLKTGCPSDCRQADIDNSGTVDLQDLVILAADWLL